MASDPTNPPLVSVRELQVIRGGKTVLDRLDLDLPRGRISALVGLNGSGKSTLLRTLLGDFPYRGQINYRCGHDHSRPRPEYVGYVPQRLALDTRLPITVRDLLGMALNKNRPLIFGLRRNLLAQMRALLNRVDAEQVLDVPVDGLSGGQLQRVLLALAIEPQPELLLLDEPSTGIDFKDEQEFYRLITQLNTDTGVTILLISHDLNTIMSHADHVFCLNAGKVCAEGVPAEVLQADNLIQYFGNTNLNLQFK